MMYLFEVICKGIILHVTNTLSCDVAPTAADLIYCEVLCIVKNIL